MAIAVKLLSFILYHYVHQHLGCQQQTSPSVDTSRTPNSHASVLNASHMEIPKVVILWSHRKSLLRLGSYQRQDWSSLDELWQSQSYDLQYKYIQLHPTIRGVTRRGKRQRHELTAHLSAQKEMRRRKSNLLTICLLIPWYSSVVSLDLIDMASKCQGDIKLVSSYKSLLTICCNLNTSAPLGLCKH